MPWKTTRLLYFGVPVRRRTLYVLALVTSIAMIPAFSWFLFTIRNPEVTKAERGVFAVAAFLTLVTAFNGWRQIFIRQAFLYWEEARFIWPAAMLGAIFSTWLGVIVNWRLPPPIWSSHPGKMSLLVPWLLALPLLFTCLWRWLRLPQAERRYEYTDDEPPPSEQPAEPLAQAKEPLPPPK